MAVHGRNKLNSTAELSLQATWPVNPQKKRDLVIRGESEGMQMQVKGVTWCPFYHLVLPHTRFRKKRVFSESPPAAVGGCERVKRFKDGVFFFESWNRVAVEV